MPIHYSTPPAVDAAKASRAKGTGLRVHFKNTRETAMAIKGMTLKRAVQYLRNVLKHKEAIPFRRHTGCIGRTAQAKNNGPGCTQGRWPVKSVRHILALLKNAKSNAIRANASTSRTNFSSKSLYISHIAVQRAPYQRRRTYRAHGRINPFMASPSHIQVVLSEKKDTVPRGKGKTQRKNLFAKSKKATKATKPATKTATKTDAVVEGGLN